MMGLASSARRTLSAAFFLAASLPVAAGSVTLHRDGAAVTGGEVCRFRAGDRDDPFRRWLTSQEVTCTAADTPLAFPPGEWNVFARTGSEAISTTPMLVDGDSPHGAMSLELVAGAILTPLLPVGRSAVVYNPARGSALPLEAGNESLVVPSGEKLWLFVVSRGRPEAMIAVNPLEAGSRHTVDARSGETAVVGWIRVSEADRRAIESVRGLALPSIYAHSPPEPARVSSSSATKLERLDGSFFTIENVPAGTGEITLDGRGWLRSSRRLTVGPGLTVVPHPLIAAAAATLMVNWSAADGLAELNASLGSCDETRRPPELELTVFACPRSRPGRPIDPEDCTSIRTETLSMALPFGSMVIEDIAPGLYQAQLRFGDLPPVRSSVLARPAQQTPVSVSASYHTVYGSITHGGEPLLEAVTIEFPGGYGFAPAGKGEYLAAVRQFPGPESQISVAACDGDPKGIILIDRPLRPNARSDLDIPDNRLDLNVTDAFTRDPLDGAIVRMDVMSIRRPPRVVMTRTFVAANGIAFITALPDRELRISVSHAGYEKHDVPPFSLASREKREIDVGLVPLRGSRGRIVSATPFAGAAVFWFSPTGQETERADLAPDGTFVYANPHEPVESMTVVSASHPLWVARSPRLELDATAAIAFPDAPPRSFSVSIPAADRSESRHVGVIVGGVRIPQPVLRQHQFLRGQEAFSRGPAALRFVDLAGTGAVEVLLGPRLEDVPAASMGMDLFALPQLSEVPRKPVPPGVTEIQFE